MQEIWVRSLGREDSPGGGHGNPLQSSCLEKPMDKEAWWATAHRVSRVRHDLATKPPPPPHHEMQQDLRKFPWGWSTIVGRHIPTGRSTWPWSSCLSKDFRGPMVAGLCLKQNHCLPYKTVTHNAPREDSAIYWLKGLLIKSSTEFPLKIFRGNPENTHTHTHTRSWFLCGN